MQNLTRVVMRVKPLVLLVGVPLLGVFVVGIGWGVVDAVVHRDAGYPFRTDGFGALGITIGWVIAGVIGFASFFALLLLVRLRVAITPDGFDARAYFRHYRVPLAGVTSINVLSGTRYPTTQPKFPGIRVTARDASGRRRGFQLNVVYTGTDRAMPVLGEWVRQRPEIVQDDLTAATFRAWGVTVPEPQRAATPARPDGPHTFLRTDGSSFTTDGSS